MKARLTLSSSGSSGGEGARTHVQVLANSVVASVLILLHYWQVRRARASQECWPYGQNLLVVGILRYGESNTVVRVLVTQCLSNYAAAAADTFSSELGILSQSKPRLLTSWNLRQVPAGTNGGVTLLGTMAGFLGAFIIALTSVTLLPFCPIDQSASSRLLDARKTGLEGGSGWSLKEKVLLLLCITAWGGLGSLLDSALGGWFQASVVDTRTGKVVEGTGGKKVIHSAGLAHLRVFVDMLASGPCLYVWH